MQRVQNETEVSIKRLKAEIKGLHKKCLRSLFKKHFENVERKIKTVI